MLIFAFFGKDLLVNLDRVVLRGQLKPADACRESGNRFVLAQRVESKRPRFSLVVLRSTSAEPPAVLGQGFDTELRLQEACADELHLALVRWMPSGGLFQYPPPSLAVVLCCWPACRQLVDYWLALGINGRTLSLRAVVIPTFFVVR